LDEELHVIRIKYKLFQTAEDLGVALFVHPWDMQEGGRFSKYWHPWLVGQLYSYLHFLFYEDVY
jgi:hypothetical protein